MSHRYLKIIVPHVKRRPAFEEARLSDLLKDGPHFEARELGLDSIAELLLEQYSYVAECGVQPRNILIGRNFFRLLFEETRHSTRYFSFSVPFMQGMKGTPAAKLMGMDVHMIPWMEGIVVTPKLEGWCPLPVSRQACISVNNWVVDTGVTTFGAPPTRLDLDIGSDMGIATDVAKEVLCNLQRGFAEWLAKPKKIFEFKWRT
jgi:hypothetical protein